MIGIRAITAMCSMNHVPPWATFTDALINYYKPHVYCATIGRAPFHVLCLAPSSDGGVTPPHCGFLYAATVLRVSSK